MCILRTGRGSELHGSERMGTGSDLTTERPPTKLQNSLCLTLKKRRSGGRRVKHGGRRGGIRWRKILGPCRQVCGRESFAGIPSVSRRRTCDRVMWRKPLARRTRGSYGFCLGDSRFVLPLQGLTERVSEFGRRLNISLRARG